MTKTSKILKFGADDLVYGPSAKGALRQLQEKAGGKLLTDIPKPPGKSWTEFSIDTLNKQLSQGGKIRFDLTNVKDITGVLNGTGKYGNTVTAAELRHIHGNWLQFQNNVTFYRNGLEVSAPW